MSSPEFELAIVACRSVFDPSVREACAEKARSADWGRLLLIARRHRIEGLVWEGMSSSGVSPPEEAGNALHASALEIAARGLNQAIHCTALRNFFTSHGVDVLFLKGVTLGKLAYGNPFVKMSWDIDILVCEGQVSEATRLLLDLGFQPTHPRRPVSGMAGWHNRYKESVWRSSDDRYFVELHSRLADNRGLIASIGMASPRHLVAIFPGIELPTLATDEAFAYLTVHGASSAWFRLKWITDLAALLYGHDESEIARLYERSQCLGAGRAAGQALLLADRLYGTSIGHRLRSRLIGDGTTRWLAASAMTLLSGRSDFLEPTDVRFGTWRIHVTQLGLVPGWRFKAGEAWRQVTDAIWSRPC